MRQSKQFNLSTSNGKTPNFWDFIALLFVGAILILIGVAASEINTPYSVGNQITISLDIEKLPYYAMRTVFRMAIALVISLLFTFIFGTLAARYRQAEKLIIPAIDILQSLPVLGFLSLTIVGFIRLFPGNLLGPECAAIFAIFTSQAWNMALSFYQSLRNMPNELKEVALLFRLNSWQKFWYIEVPFATPSLLWNMMISLSGGWFFVVASEAILVSNQEILLPGIGSYIAVAITTKNISAIIYAIISMLIVILLYDQLFFRPLLVWSEKFTSLSSYNEGITTSWIYNIFKRTKMIKLIGNYSYRFKDAIINFGVNTKRPTNKIAKYKLPYNMAKIIKIWEYILGSLIILSVFIIGQFILPNVSFTEIITVFYYGFITALRVFILIFLCSILWVPVGVWVGLRPHVAHIIQPIAQFLAAFPANLLFPIVVMFIVYYDLNTNIWTSPLMILGTQWYILFNVIVGTMAIPRDLQQAADIFQVKGILWWKKIALPAVFPYYVTGALAAAGGAWNASILAEVVVWGDRKLVATGLGAYITNYTEVGDFPRIVLGMFIMCVYVLLLNRFFWQRLYDYAQTKFNIN